MSTEDYLSLITTEHKQPKFLGVVSAVIDPLTVVVDVIKSFDSELDLDTAIGKQLDLIGEWVGIDRNIPIPITGVYFTWGGLESEGWGRGVWKAPTDPDDGITSLNDESYRLVLKTKIARNTWDGTKDSAYKALDAAFGVGAVIIFDGGDMSQTLLIGQSVAMSTLDIELINQGLLEFRPAGVKSRYALASGPKTFCWGIPENDNLGGWGVGSWATFL